MQQDDSTKGLSNLCESILVFSDLRSRKSIKGAMMMLRESPVDVFKLSLEWVPSRLCAVLSMISFNKRVYEINNRWTIPTAHASGVYLVSHIFECKGCFSTREQDGASPICFFELKDIMIKTRPLVLRIYSTPDHHIVSMRFTSGINDLSYAPITPWVGYQMTIARPLRQFLPSITIPTKLLPKTILMLGVIHNVCTFEFSAQGIRIQGRGNDGYMMETLIENAHSSYYPHGDEEIQNGPFSTPLRFKLNVAHLKSIVYISESFQTLTFSIESPHLHVHSQLRYRSIGWAFLHTQI